MAHRIIVLVVILTKQVCDREPSFCWCQFIRKNCSELTMHPLTYIFQEITTLKKFVLARYRKSVLAKMWLIIQPVLLFYGEQYKNKVNSRVLNNIFNFFQVKPSLDQYTVCWPSLFLELLNNYKWEGYQVCYIAGLLC